MSWQRIFSVTLNGSGATRLGYACADDGVAEVFRDSRSDQELWLRWPGRFSRVRTLENDV